MIEILIGDDNKVSLKTTNRFDPSVVQVKVIDDKEWL